MAKQEISADAAARDSDKLQEERRELLDEQQKRIDEAFVLQGKRIVP